MSWLRRTVLAKEPTGNCDGKAAIRLSLRLTKAYTGVWSIRNASVRRHLVIIHSNNTSRERKLVSMKKINIYAIIAAIVAVIGDFMPYYYISWYYGGWNRYTTTLIKQDFLGVAVLVTAVLMILFAVLHKRIPFIITAAALMLTELVYIYVTLTHAEIYILSVPETGTLLLPGFYMAVAAVVLSLVAIIKSKKVERL